MLWPAVEPSQPPNVLVLDDGPAACTALADNGFAVPEVQTGEEAMHLLHERPFDLILLDMNVSVEQAGRVLSNSQVRSRLQNHYAGGGRC